MSNPSNRRNRNRARVLTPDAQKKLRETIREHEAEHNAGMQYTWEKLGEITGLDPETVKKVVECRGSDKRKVARCFEAFGLTLTDSDHIPAAQAAPPVADPHFVGREGAIADLDDLVRQGKKLILILGGAGFGKTTLARKYLDQRFNRVIKVVLAKERKDVASVEGLIEEKLKELGEEPGREFAVSLERFRRKVETEKIGILIDNLEPALDSNGCFVPERRLYVELLRVLDVDTVQSVTLITSRDPLHEPALTVTTYELKGLSIEAWQQFFTAPQLSPKIVMDLSILTDMHKQYGGNAKAMEILRGAVQQDNSGNLKAYWERNRDDLLRHPGLENLVVEQFKRLQEIAPNAYTLLCRLGCYRYQSVPTLPIEGLLCLLWDVPDRKMRVVDALKNRSLVECKDERYWLHPMIRAEAIERLRNSEDWNTVNQKIASFWLKSFQSFETMEDALRGFEAFFHYMESGDFTQAANTLIESKMDDSSDFENLGYACWRLGLFREVISAIDSIQDKVNDAYILSSLNRILGYAHNLTGSINDAIRFHEKSGRIALEYLKSESKKSDIQGSKVNKYTSVLREMVIAHFINIGVAKLSLWELEKALELFQKAISLYNTEGFYEYRYWRYWIEDLCCLAFVKSCLGFEREALILAEDACSKYSQAIPMSRWGKAYCPLMLGKVYRNSNKVGKAFEMYQLSIQYSRTCDFIHAEANALSGLAEIYRSKNEFLQSIFNHNEAIKILAKIEAKCDLAEAYYQLGLTYQVMGEPDQGNENFQEAIRLFEEIGAPKQVVRVRQVMGGLE